MTYIPIPKYTGWADYTDTTYTEGSPLALTAATDTLLPNNAGTVRDTYKPKDITTFYAPNSITYDNESVAFTTGLTVTGGTSGATANIVAIQDNGLTGILYVDSLSGTFQENETITDSGSGSATVDDTDFNGKILGREGDSFVLTIDFKAKPTNGSTTYLEVWVDIGGAVGELYRRIITFPKGINVEREVTFSTGEYSLDTWEENGGDVYVSADNTADIYDIRYVFIRTSKAF